MDPKLFDMNSIFSVAQKIAKDIKTKNPDLNKDSDNIDMSSIIQQVTQSVGNVVTPDFLDKMGGNQSSNSANQQHGKKHKKSIKNTNAKTPDINFDLPVTLYDIYHGKTKKINIKVDRLKKTDGGELKLVTDKVKFHVDVAKGILDGSVIKFEGQADQKPGFKTGDINITIRIEEDDKFERDGDNIVYHHFCSLSECYDLNFTFTHPNGNVYQVLSNTPTFNFTNPIKVIKGLGMPIVNEETEETESEYGDLIVLLHFALPYELNEEQIKTLTTLFPPLLKKEEDSTEVDDTIFADDADYEKDEEDDDEEDEEDEEDIQEDTQEEVSIKNVPNLEDIQEDPDELNVKEHKEEA